MLEEKFRDIVHKPSIEVSRGGRMILEPATLKGNILLHVHLHRRTRELESTPDLLRDLHAMLHKVATATAPTLTLIRTPILNLILTPPLPPPRSTAVSV